MNTKNVLKNSDVFAGDFTQVTAKDTENPKHLNNRLRDLCALCGGINSAAHEVWFSGG